MTQHLYIREARQYATYQLCWQFAYSKQAQMLRCKALSDSSRSITLHYAELEQNGDQPDWGVEKSG